MLAAKYLEPCLRFPWGRKCLEVLGNLTPQVPGTWYNRGGVPSCLVPGRPGRVGSGREEKAWLRDYIALVSFVVWPCSWGKRRYWVHLKPVLYFFLTLELGQDEPDGTASLGTLRFMRRGVLSSWSSSCDLTCFPATEGTWGREGCVTGLLSFCTIDVWAG